MPQVEGENTLCSTISSFLTMCSYLHGRDDQRDDTQLERERLKVGLLHLGERKFTESHESSPLIWQYAKSSKQK